MNFRFLFAIVIVFTLLGGCASNSAQQQAEANQQQNVSDPRDPIEGFNRTIWDFNYDVLDAYLLRPAAVAYSEYVPGFARTGLKNMANNLEEPANVVNNLLQGKVGDSMVSVGRFLVNSTLGLLGSLDVATEMGMQVKKEEFGQTLGVWGAETGPYLMLPALGPSDVRSGAGDLVDSAYFPLADLNFYFSALRMAVNALEGRAALISQEQQLNNSADPYAFVKNAYFQNLQFKVQDGEIEMSEEDEQADDELDAFLEDF
jgi:phospholipid-binding lipoprotein MlaA